MKTLTRTKQTILLGAGLLLALAATTTAVLADGGVSGGGGGGVVPVNPVDPMLVRAAAQRSRLDLTLYFNSESELRRRMPRTAAELLFDGPRTIFDVIRDARIELAEDKPCYNAAHEEKDGSAPGSQPDSICISVFTIAKKLTVDNYRAQTIALIGHEFTHLLGADEATAVAIQTALVDQLRAIGEDHPADMRARTPALLEDISGAIARAFPFGFGRPDPNEAQLHKITGDLFALTKPILESPYFSRTAFRVLDAAAGDAWLGAYRKLQVVYFTACAQDRSPDNYRAQICADWLASTFGTATELTLPELEKRLNGNRFARNPPQFRIKRVQKFHEIRLEALEARRDIRSLAALIDSLPPMWADALTGQASAPVAAVNHIAWKTSQVSLTADDFRIVADDKGFYGNPAGAELRSDPGHSTYWTFESTWYEHGRQMRLNIYFKSDGNTWWSEEIRIYDGQVRGEWITFNGRFFETPLGQIYSGELDVSGRSKDGVRGELHLKGLKIQAQLH